MRHDRDDYAHVCYFSHDLRLEFNWNGVLEDNVQISQGGSGEPLILAIAPIPFLLAGSHWGSVQLGRYQAWCEDFCDDVRDRLRSDPEVTPHMDGHGDMTWTDEEVKQHVHA